MGKVSPVLVGKDPTVFQLLTCQPFAGSFVEIGFGGSYCYILIRRTSSLMVQTVVTYDVELPFNVGVRTCREPAENARQCEHEKNMCFAHFGSWFVQVCS